jgi:molybdenum-dependent DNA-binding transcriptional regulator ModE
MNIIHLRYAVEIAKTKSISKAAENLYMGQPNLSRAIRELEEGLGIIIFNRTSKGISITPDGEEFLQYAKRILSQLDEMEELYHKIQDRCFADDGGYDVATSIEIEQFDDETEISNDLDFQNPVCPECGSKLYMEGGCVICRDCGWSRCE